MIAASLHVQRGQIESPVFARILEQVIGHFLRHGSIHGLRHLVHQSADVLVAIAALVQVVRLAQHLTQSLGADVFVRRAPSLDGRGQQRVAEAEGGRTERRR